LIAAGIDMGIQSAKVAILKDGILLSKGKAFCGFKPTEAADEAFEEALTSGKLSRNEIQHVTATGAGVNLVSHFDSTISMMGADAQAGVYFFPSARTVVDVGAEEARAVSCDERGNMLDFVVNSRCAAGAGTFIEAMARALEVKLEEMGHLSIKAEEATPINASCVIFAESDVVSLIHRQKSKEKIARAIYAAMADRISSMMRRLGIKPEVVLVGGVAEDVGFTAALERKLGMKILIPEDPVFAGSIGAALIASKRIAKVK
jgi:benzoyl-CoA reductase subunit D